MESVDGASAVLRDGAASVAIGLPARGTHYAVDAAAAYATAKAVLGEPVLERRPPPTALSAIPAVFGRGERVTVRGQQVEFVLVQNPASYQLNVDSIAPGTEQILFAIGSDVRDPSYFWPTDASSLGRVAIVSGSKAAEAALMLAYDGVGIDRVEPDLSRALDDFLAAPAPAERREDHRLLRRLDAAHPRAPRTHGSGMTLTIASLIPSLQNTNGDAENAAGARRRARAGRASTRASSRWSRATTCPTRVDAVVIGSGSDSTLDGRARPPAHDARRAPSLGHRGRAHPRGRDRLGTAQLGRRARTARRTSRGSASCPDARCRAPNGSPATSSSRRRASACSSASRTTRATTCSAEASPLGRVRAGRATGAAPQEGVVMGDVVGTHLHGPVLAKNPRIGRSRS